MSDYPERIRVLLAPSADADALDLCEDALLDELDEILGDVAGTESFEGRHCINVAVRDLLSGAIGLRRILSPLPQAKDAELILIDASGAEQRVALSSDA